jgi:uncharacterized hydrophobic protein (TIGR00271 family)
MPKIQLIHDPTIEKNLIQNILEKLREQSGKPIEAMEWHENFIPQKDDTLFVLLADRPFAEWIYKIASLPVTIIPLPWPNNPAQCDFFNLPKNIDHLIEAAFNPNARFVQTLTLCHDEILLEPFTVCAHPQTEPASPLHAAVWRIFSTKLHPLKITTGSGQEIKTAALTIEAGHEFAMHRRRPWFFKESDNLCRRTTAVVYAPQSVAEALKLRLYLARRKEPGGDTLAPGIGTIKSENITIEPLNGHPLHYRIANRTHSAPQIQLRTLDTRARFFVYDTPCHSGEAKESLRIQNLPSDPDLIAFYTKKSLPIVPIAPESRFAELFTRLRETAKMPAYYLALLVISVLMATVGLFQNAAPTIIGAMILAPLMAPIIAFAMASVRFDTALLRRSAATIAVSVGMAIGISALLAWALPFGHMTEQMAMRTHPTLLDLAVAILSGIAAAYGFANSKVGESLAGVAIAVALVPPLCVSGIGLGWADLSMFWGAFLLFGANFAGILLAAGLTFYLLGYASTRYASAAFLLKLAAVALVAAPLWLSTRALLAEEPIYRAFADAKPIRIDRIEARIHLRKVLHRPDGLYAILYVTSAQPLDPAQKRELAQKIKQRLPQPIKLIVTYQELY